MKNIDLIVEGVHCIGCEMRIKNVLSSIDGIQEVNTSFQDKKVHIISNNSINIDNIKEKIEDLGFKVLKDK